MASRKRRSFQGPVDCSLRGEVVAASPSLDEVLRTVEATPLTTSSSFPFRCLANRSSWGWTGSRSRRECWLCGSQGAIGPGAAGSVVQVELKLSRPLSRHGRHGRALVHPQTGTGSSGRGSPRTLEPASLISRLGKTKGWLYRGDMTILADRGVPLDIDTLDLREPGMARERISSGTAAFSRGSASPSIPEPTSSTSETLGRSGPQCARISPQRDRTAYAPHPPSPLRLHPRPGGGGRPLIRPARARRLASGPDGLRRHHAARLWRSTGSGWTRSRRRLRGG